MRFSKTRRGGEIQCVEVNDSKIQTPNRLDTKHHSYIGAHSGVKCRFEIVRCCCYYVDTKESCMAPNHSLRRLNNAGNTLGHRSVWGLFFTLTCRVFVSVCVSSERMGI